MVLPLDHLGRCPGRTPRRGAILNLTKSRLYTNYCFNPALPRAQNSLALALCGSRVILTESSRTEGEGIMP